jgi:hypothetical protein
MDWRERFEMLFLLYMDDKKMKTIEDMSLEEILDELPWYIDRPLMFLEVRKNKEGWQIWYAPWINFKGESLLIAAQKMLKMYREFISNNPDNLPIMRWYEGYKNENS